MKYPQDENGIEDQNSGCSNESLFFSDGTEYEIGILLGNVFQFCLCSLEKALSCQSSRTDGNLRLIHIISGAIRVILHAEDNVDSGLLMRLQHIVKDKIA